MFVQFCIINSLLLLAYAYNNEERVTMEKSIDFFESDNWIQERGITSNDYISATVSN